VDRLPAAFVVVALARSRLAPLLQGAVEACDLPV